MLVGALTENATFLPIVCILFVLTIILLIVVQPFKRTLSQYTTITAMFLLLLALWYGFIIATERASIIVMPESLMCVGAIVGSLPLLYISGIVLHWIYRNRKFGSQLIQKLRAWRQGYEILK